LGIINDILDFSKIEAGRLEIESIDYDLESGMQNLADIVLFRANEKGLTLVYNYAPQVPLSLVGDPLRLEQVLVNLVNNAIKFTGQGEVVVHIGVKSESDQSVELLFAVSDTGIGLKQEEKNNLFKAFSQADVSISRKYGGSGLGLAICKRLTSLMGGEIWVESEYGQGSTFSFTIKAGKQAVQKKEQMRHAFESSGEKVLIADANATSSGSLQNMLTDFGYSVTRCATANALYKKLEAEGEGDPYKIVFLDGNIFEGQEAAGKKKLKAYEAFFEHLICLVTPFTEERVKSEWNGPGHPVLLNKPASYTLLFDSLMDALMGEVPAAEAMGSKRKVYRELLKKQRSLRVLVVDDTASNRSLAVELLDMANIKADVVAGGQEAIDLAIAQKGSCPFDLVLMDINMPEMDGYSATRHLKQVKGWEEVPVAAMTAEAFGDVEGLCLQAGMVGMVAKPIDPEDLFKVIYRLIIGEEEVSSQQEGPEESLNYDFPDITGLDVQTGIRRMAGRTDLYKRLLKGFCHDYEQFESQIHQLISDDNQESLGRLLHTLKGIVGTMEAPGLYALAIETEKEFRKEGPELNALIEKLIREVRYLVDRLKESPVFISNN
jgi:CheY-like chemotaxis protein